MAQSRSEGRAAALLLAGLLAAAAPAAAEERRWADPDCDPVVETALEDGARRGVEAETAVIRDPEAGIRDPDSILDFSCIADMFDFRVHNVLFDPGRAMSDILGLIQRRACAAARQAYHRYVGRPVDPGLWAARETRLPGLGVPILKPEPLDFPDNRPTAAPVVAPPRPAAPSSAPDRYRNLYGGGR